MTQNVGTLDRALRAILGIVLVALPFVVDLGSQLWLVLSVLVGVVMILVAITRICPIYSIFGISSCTR